MSEPDENVVDMQLRECLHDAVPAAVESCLRARLAEFRSGPSVRKPAAPTRVGGLSRNVWSGLGLTCAAAVLCAVVVGLLLRPRASFAEVASAVLKQPWVHVRYTTSGEHQSEVWFAPAKHVLVTRYDGSITYEDYLARVVDSYDPREGVVYHAPIVWHSRAHYYETMVEALATLLQGDRAPEKPLARLDFLGPERETMRVVNQRVERLTDGGRAWLDYYLVVNDPKSPKPLRMLFRVDAVTRLPSLSRVDHVNDGNSFTVETRFDYPETGPADIYDLGVPKTAKRVDRVPADDIQRILDTIRAGRVRMDDYRAIFVMHLDGLDYSWWLDIPQIFYRKGMKLRADYVSVVIGGRAAVNKPDPGDDLGKWWRERTKSCRYHPMYVVHPSTTYFCDVKTKNNPDGTSYDEIVSVQRVEFGNEPGEIYPPEYSMRPEFACRPPLGIGDARMEPILDLHPTDGPPGCVRLSVRDTSTNAQANPNRVKGFDVSRYWLDPQRDFIVMRWDAVMRDATGQEKVAESDTTEQIARSPQGVWYATRIRRSFPNPDKGKAKSLDQVYHLYVDFNVDLPDSFFEPPQVGKTP
jgi:hypothetical protein